MSKKEIIGTTGEQRQRYLMNCAKIAVSEYGSGFEARLDIISLLCSIKSDINLKDKFGEDIFNKLNDIKLAVSEMVSYKSDISKKALKKEDVASERFLRYKQAISKCYRHLFLLDKVWVFLAKGTDLEDMTIPSHYWAYACASEIKMPEEIERDITVGEDLEG